jgi:phosphopantothenoylcysteine decarboxylase/phosphopantothenate--cysteine ligase
MRVALGITGGIAAYKAAELVRVLQDKGVEVQVVMTRHACEFVRPLTFAALSGHKVITEMFGESGAQANLESAIEHIAVAQSIEALVIAPATANTLAKLARGLADDFLSTLALATKAPVIVAPAMNVNMWEHAATQENLQILRGRGVTVVPPDEGYLACGMTGAGRLASIEAISRAVFEALGIRDDLKGETVLVTAGPTEEPLDPVRFLSNRSSGKMGYAIAEAARRRGANVILVSGPASVQPPERLEVIRVRTAEEMADSVMSWLPRASTLIMAAAVADFRPARVSRSKLKKAAGIRSIRLTPTCDILRQVSRQKQAGQIVVGFAAETDDLLDNARTKLRSKKLDLIVANDVTQEGAGFDADTNIVTLVFADGTTRPLEKMTKLELGHRILDEIVRLRRTKD